MTENTIAATVFAVAGAICWSLQLVPQIVLNYKRKSTDGFSGLMMLLWVMAGVPLGIYNIIQSLNIGLQIQPSVICFLNSRANDKAILYGVRAHLLSADVPL
jgi:uncharacterized protein with PQ loop repeat